jgi:hypothetical protein
LFIAADHGHLHQAARQFHRQADRHFQAMLDSGLHQQTVDHTSMVWFLRLSRLRSSSRLTSSPSTRARV